MDSASIEPGKIFVGGLSWETTKENLKAYFEKYGEVSDCVIMKDTITNKPRGFGFVTFKDQASVQSVIANGPHTLDGKVVDPKPATMKSATPSGGSTGPVKKVFVGGIANGTTEDDVRQYFLTFGNVNEVDLKYDKATGRMRGFGFVGFDSEEVVDKLCQTHFHQINGKTVEVKKAEPRYATAIASGSYGGARAGNMMGGYAQNFGGAFGGGRGGYSAPSHNYYGGYGNYGGQAAQYGYGYGTTYNQSGYGQQYSQGAYSGYDRFPSGQQSTATGEQSRSDYPSYTYSQQQLPGGYQESGYASRSTYGSAPDSYNQHGSYSYSSDSTGYSYPDSQGAAKGQYGRGTASRGFGGPYQGAGGR